MWNDPIVAEVRAVRERIAAECDYDLHRMFERQREIVRRWEGKVVGRGDLPRKLQHSAATGD